MAVFFFPRVCLTFVEAEADSIILYFPLCSILVSVSRSQYTATLSVIAAILAPQPPPSGALSRLVDRLHGSSPDYYTQDDAAWNQTTFLKAVQTFLIVSIDSRPKPRKRAQEVVRNIVWSV
jgi:ribosomal RNA-processing protein 12